LATLQVTMMNETSMEEFVVRELRLTNLRERGASRTLRHMHYMVSLWGKVFQWHRDKLPD
jgi:hypothetical protein